MSPSAPLASFDASDVSDVSDISDDDPLAATASAVTRRAADDPAHGTLVVITHPTADDHRVIASGGTGVLRAAVSVAVAAGNDRLWRDAPTGRTAESPTRALPEVVAAAADAGGVRAVHTGCVRRDDAVEAVAIWFETWTGVARAEDRETVLALLATAAEAASVAAARRAAIVAAAAAEQPAVQDATVRTFDPHDPRLESVTGLLAPAAFDESIAAFEGDEATILLIDLDGLDAIGTARGDAAVDAVRREIADRVAAACRRGDVIACIGHDRFAILLNGVDRSASLELGRRLLNRLGEPLPPQLGTLGVTATMALAHQAGLVDLDEMLESARAAVASGRRSGSGRLVLAA